MLAAVETERPIPVPIATQATMQSGHFGKIARTRPGISHLAALKRLLKTGGRQLPFALSILPVSQQV